MVQPANLASRPASTLIVLRESLSGPPQLLMMERAATMAFAPGALVFPGGATDADDVALAERLGTDLPVDEAASRIGAIRETLEESGIAPGLGTSDDAVLAELRRDLSRGIPFSTLVAGNGLTLNIDALIPFARWHPNAGERVRRVFDTRFYLARYDSEGPEPVADETENLSLFWDSAAGVLGRCDAGQGRVIFPTRRNLERLAQFSTIDALERHACAFAVEKIVPWIEERAEDRYLCIPDHLGYPVCFERLETAFRT
ncbi:NUDIX hydrolase [Sphingobium sp. SCG-1]|uniref:NUDIX hydrolase n=1 Tax=Sphingobium sp. SCG-1 TaxID=2072936 RepID=UPI000CD67A30|nr:NUDIX hydrolase [Sphingobium sp. SCG-1]AUW60397.1 NUDIX hydrolase [Sphingobium sp. SCG-1]